MTKEIFSVYKSPITSVIPDQSLSLGDVWERITDRTLKDQTDSLRILLQEGRGSEYKQQKTNILPFATFGGVFDYRSKDSKRLAEKGKTGLLSPSGLVIVDIDHISEIGLDLESLRETLSEDQEIGVRLVFKSPSGDGLKVVCKSSGITDKDSYKTVFTSLLHYISDKYQIQISDKGLDKSGSDITRGCLLCNDPRAILRDWDFTYNPELHKQPEPERNTPLREIYNLQDFGGEDGIEEIVSRVERAGIDIAPEYGDYIGLVYSFTALGERGRGLLHRVCRLSAKYNQENTDKDFDKCSESGETQSIGTFVNLAKRMGIDVSKPVEIPQRADLQSQRKTKTGTPEAMTPKSPEDIQKDREGRYRKYLEIPKISDILSTKREGIETEYIFGNKKEALTLRSGAMTLICGKSSHGKSKFLQNLALRVAMDYTAGEGKEEGDVLFFTYEEELSDVLLQFANIQINTPQLSKYGTPNTEVIKDYLRTGSLDRCTSDKRENIQTGVSQFNKLYESGKLRIYYSDLYSEDLCDLIRYYATKRPIKAVFVDYVQLLYKGGYRKDRKEEIKDICNDLRTTAIDLSIPFVLSAQLNRQTPNPSEMSEDNIADSADLTRYANTIVCLWNSYFDNVTGGKETYLQKEEGKNLQRRGFNLGEGGQIYAKITKNRGGTPNIDSILQFTGETGNIAPSKEDLPDRTDQIIPHIRIYD